MSLSLMSLRLISLITITQVPQMNFPNRSNVYTIDFVNDVEINSSWKNLTTTCKIVMPRNIYVKTPSGNVSWVNQSAYVPVTGNTTPPIIMRGDKITVQLGYYYNPGNGYAPYMNTEFSGYITKVNPKIPLEIECEDAMWLLKQAQCPNKVFPAASWNVQSIIQYLLKNSSVNTGNTYLNSVLLPALAQVNVINGVGLSENVQTNIGDFRTVNETIAGVLFRLRKDYKLDCFFRPTLTNGSPSAWNSLYVSGIVYYPQDYINSDGSFNTVAYGFQQNITDGKNLMYLRKDDVRLGIKAYSVSKYELATTNSAGAPKTKNARLEVNVGDTDGDIRTQFFWPATNTSPDLNLTNLTALATQRLNKLKFEGWRGDFTSFGLPYVQHGMAISLNDTVQTGPFPGTMERQGIYLVKGVKVKFGANNQPAFSRTMDLHLRLDNQNYQASDFDNGL